MHSESQKGFVIPLADAAQREEESNEAFPKAYEEGVAVLQPLCVRERCFLEYAENYESYDAVCRVEDMNRGDKDIRSREAEYK